MRYTELEKDTPEDLMDIIIMASLGVLVLPFVFVSEISSKAVYLGKHRLLLLIKIACGLNIGIVVICGALFTRSLSDLYKGSVPVASLLISTIALLILWTVLENANLPDCLDNKPVISEDDQEQIIEAQQESAPPLPHTQLTELAFEEPEEDMFDSLQISNDWLAGTEMYSAFGEELTLNVADSSQVKENNVMTELHDLLYGGLDKIQYKDGL